VRSARGSSEPPVRESSEPSRPAHRWVLWLAFWLYTTFAMALGATISFVFTTFLQKHLGPPIERLLSGTPPPPPVQEQIESKEKIIAQYAKQSQDAKQELAELQRRKLYEADQLNWIAKATECYTHLSSIRASLIEAAMQYGNRPLPKEILGVFVKPKYLTIDHRAIFETDYSETTVECLSVNNDQIVDAQQLEIFLELRISQIDGVIHRIKEAEDRHIDWTVFRPTLASMWVPAPWPSKPASAETVSTSVPARPAVPQPPSKSKMSSDRAVKTSPSPFPISTSDRDRMAPELNRKERGRICTDYGYCYLHM
jgi:hypothetical protein